MVRRNAFTLIELIFAIVIMAITVMSLPLILDVDSQARDRNLAQEAVLSASTKLSQVLTYQWDEASLSWTDLAENYQTTARIVDGTNAVTNAFDRIGTPPHRENNISNNNRNFFTAVTNATAIGTDDSGLVMGMDEQNLTASALSGFEAGFTANAEGYKKNYQISVDILRISDALAPGGGTVDYNQTNLTGNNRFIFSQTEPAGIGTGQTNIRGAKVSIMDGSGNLVTTLYGYAANIGEYKVYSKDKP